MNKKSGRALDGAIGELVAELALKELARLRAIPIDVSGLFAGAGTSKTASSRKPAARPPAASSRPAATSPAASSRKPAASSPKAPGISRKASAVATEAPHAMLMLMLPPDEPQIAPVMSEPPPPSELAPLTMLQPDTRSDEPREAESEARWAETWTEREPELAAEAWTEREPAAEQEPELAAEAWTEREPAAETWIERGPELAAEESRRAYHRRRREERAERRRERRERARQRREAAAARQVKVSNPATDEPDESAEPPIASRPFNAA